MSEVGGAVMKGASGRTIPCKEHTDQAQSSRHACVLPTSAQVLASLLIWQHTGDQAIVEVPNLSVVGFHGREHLVNGM